MILQDHARRVQDRETDVRRILVHFTGAIVLFYGIFRCCLKKIYLVVKNGKKS